jgi:hypothetical protein
VDTDPFEDAEVVRAYQERNGYPWMMAPFSRETILAYDVKVQSTKFAVDVDGIITYQKGYRIGSADAWLQVLEALAPGGG